jgi:hypothetical protein
MSGTTEPGPLERRLARKKAQQELRDRKIAQGLAPLAVAALPNRKSEYGSVEEEQQARQEAITTQWQIMGGLLPVLLARLEKIPDPRQPKKIKHKMTMVLLYGIMMFVHQMSSRREANQKMTHPQFMENLALAFPDLDQIPHHDTLNRLLSAMDVDQIPEAHIELLRRLIRKKKFVRYLIDGRYPVAIDGTQKLVRAEMLSEEWLQRYAKDEERATQYYVYTLEANLALRNGMSIPLTTEFLVYSQGDIEHNKQDCELRAFKRMAVWLKKQFSRRSLLLLLDGLYPNGPLMAECRRNGWDFMIVLQDKSLRTVWEEYNGLKSLQPENYLKQKWGDRTQRFRWVNQIEYEYGEGRGRRHIKIHVVVCQESWEDLVGDGLIIDKESRHAWISSCPLSRGNIHERCNLGARHRWAIESGLLVEKRQGYNYEHCFSFNWEAMKGYHYLMRLAHLLNILVQYSSALRRLVRRLGVRGFADFLWETIVGPWLDAKWVRSTLAKPFQLRLE